MGPGAPSDWPGSRPLVAPSAFPQTRPTSGTTTLTSRRMGPHDSASGRGQGTKLRLDEGKARATRPLWSAWCDERLANVLDPAGKAAAWPGCVSMISATPTRASGSCLAVRLRTYRETSATPRQCSPARLTATSARTIGSARLTNGWPLDFAGQDRSRSG